MRGADRRSHRSHRSHRTSIVRVVVALFAGLATTSSAYAQIAVTSPTLVERTVAPGETYRDTITVHNSSNVVQTVSFSQVDYQFDATGATEFGAPGSEPRSNTGWIALGQRAVTLLPHEDNAVSYTVAVPSGAPAPFGTYWSVVLVEVERSPDVTAHPNGLALVSKLRYAVQLATHVGKTGDPTLTFGEPRLLRSAFAVNIQGAVDRYQTPGVASLAADRSLVVDISHTGTRGCRPTLRVEVYQQDGTLAHTATAQRGLLYPGASIRQTFELPFLPAGEYTVLLLADVGIDKVQGAKFQIHVQ